MWVSQASRSWNVMGEQLFPESSIVQGEPHEHAFAHSFATAASHAPSLPQVAVVARTSRTIESPESICRKTTPAV